MVAFPTATHPRLSAAVNVIPQVAQERAEARANRSFSAKPSYRVAKQARVVAAHGSFRHRDTDHPLRAHADPTPVLDVSNTGEQKYFNTWIAEVATVHANGALLQRYMGFRAKHVRPRHWFPRANHTLWFCCNL